MQGGLKLKEFSNNAVIKDAILVSAGAIVSFRLIFLSINLFGISLEEIFHAVLGKPSAMWERSSTDLLCIMGLGIIFLGVCMVSIDTCINVYNEFLKKK